jgi:hypothetical protein
MSKHDADLTLRQIVEVCDKAIELRNSMTWAEFRGDWRKQMLAERLVEVLSERRDHQPVDDGIHPALALRRAPREGMAGSAVVPAPLRRIPEPLLLGCFHSDWPVAVNLGGGHSWKAADA